MTIMFMREIKSKGKTYLRIVETYREHGKVKQKSIASLGCLDKLNETQIQKIAISLLKYCKDNLHVLDVRGAKEKERKRWGAVKVFTKLWEQFEFPKLFGSIIQGRKIQFDPMSAVFLMLMDRLLEPKSKLKSYEEQDKYYGIKENELHHLYRALDILSDSKERIEEYIFKKNVSLWNMEVDVVFYDVTTLYFESEKVDELRDFGFSKDSKTGDVQVLLGLLVDGEGRPVGFDIFPGNTFEGNTLKEALNKLSGRFSIRRLILIADSAMLSSNNLDCIKECGYEYIVGGRIKSKSQKIKEEILDKDGYVSLVVDGEEEEQFMYKNIKIGEDALIASWSSKRARKDYYDRNNLVLKAEKFLSKGGNQIVSKRGALKYIKTESGVKGKLDEHRIKEEEKWDGYYGIQTNSKDLSPQMVLKSYRGLWRVEESFRILKSHLESRPVFHWTPRRIKGHLVLCFIAFLLERTLEILLRKNKIEYSPSKIRKALDDLQFSEIEIEGRSFFLRSEINGLANYILRALQIRIPPQIASTANF
jgi:transposase